MNGKSIKKLTSDYAIENFKNGLNCSESVYEALIRSGALQVPKETLAMAIGFGGGIGLAGFTCGALSASVMACGAVHGRKDPWAVASEDRGKEIQAKYYRRYNRMVHDFVEANGSALCKEICSVYGDFHSKERRINCLKLVGKTAALAVDYLNMGQDKAFELPYQENIAGLEWKGEKL